MPTRLTDYPSNSTITSYPSIQDSLKGKMQCVVLPSGQILDSERGVPQIEPAPTMRAVLPVSSTETAISILDSWNVFSDSPVFKASTEGLIPGAEAMLSSVNSIVDKSEKTVKSAAKLVESGKFASAREQLKLLKSFQKELLGKQFPGIGIGTSSINDRTLARLARAGDLSGFVQERRGASNFKVVLGRKELTRINRIVKHEIRNETRAYTKLSRNVLVTNKKFLKNLGAIQNTMAVLPVGISLVDWANAQTEDELRRAARNFRRASAKAAGGFIAGGFSRAASSYLVLVFAPLAGGTLAVVAIGAIAVGVGLAAGFYADKFVDQYLPQLERQ